MDLVIVRHAHAVDVGEDGVDRDEKRYLTDEGKRKAKRAAEYLAEKIDSVDRIYTSPLVRARETSDILARVLSVEHGVVESEYLEPGQWCRGKGVLSVLKGERCVVVGHNPDLEELASFCLGGKDHYFIEMKKAGVCWISFEGPAAEGEGLLRMLLTPSSLSR